VLDRGEEEGRVGTAAVAIKALGAGGARRATAPRAGAPGPVGAGSRAARRSRRTSAFTSGGALALDARLGGPAAAIAVACRGPVLVTVVVAAATTAAIRLFAG
jgi:hypothetical protein